MDREVTFASARRVSTSTATTASAKMCMQNIYDMELYVIFLKFANVQTYGSDVCVINEARTKIVFVVFTRYVYSDLG